MRPLRPAPPHAPSSDQPHVKVMLDDAALAWARGDSKEALALWSVARKREPDRSELKELVQFGFAVLEEEERASRPGGDHDLMAADVPELDSPYSHLRAVGPKAPFAPPKATMTAAERQALRTQRAAALARRARVARVAVLTVGVIAGGVAFGFRQQEHTRATTIETLRADLDKALARGQLNAAQPAYAALKENAGSGAARDALVYYYGGQLALLSGNVSEAVRQSELALTGEQERAGPYHWGYAKSLRAAGRLPEALIAYSRAFTEWADGAMWLDYADALMEAGKLEHAESLLGLIVTNKRPDALEAMARLRFVAAARGDSLSAAQLAERVRETGGAGLSTRAQVLLDSIPPAFYRDRMEAKAPSPSPRSR